MGNRPSLPEIITVNSEQLQTVIRDLLPSQNGFGSELQASNVITPIIDLTAAAEGSALPFDLQSAQSFGSQTAFNVNNTTTTLANSPGFWRIQGNVFMGAGGGCSFNVTDGLSSKLLYNYVMSAGSTGFNVPFDYLIFLASGESVNFFASAQGFASGSYRQVADAQGQLIEPNGFPV